MSVAHGKRANLLHAILSIQVLNTATPVLLGIVGFGWALYVVERRANSRQFRSQAAAVCACMLPRTDARAARCALTCAPLGADFAFVSTATFGFGGASCQSCVVPLGGTSHAIRGTPTAL